jgi:hypothetical protein
MENVYRCNIICASFGCNHNPTSQKNIRLQRNLSKLEKYVCFVIQNHGNHGKLLLFHFYECQKIQNKNLFDEIFNFKFDLRSLKMNTYCVRWSQFCKGLLKILV